MEFRVDELDWGKGEGLLPAVVQDDRCGRVLMVAYMNREALLRTLETRRVTFWSRSRRGLWTKGETSGNYLRLRSIAVDCDRDALLVSAIPEGPTCHRGSTSCFDESDRPAGPGFLLYLEQLVRSRREALPDDSYTAGLFRSGINRIGRKLGEEAVETILSMNEAPERTVEESADLIFHLLVFLVEREVALESVLGELSRRHGEARSGLGALEGRQGEEAEG
jgi:phosphoribosyl-AMP cyclohydrolase / phosphoribosyl-ATP pyrophosphohydrolase